MVDLEYVSRFIWNESLGQRLKSLRGKMSRRSLAEQLKATGRNCSHQFIQKLENGGAESIEPALLIAICQVLGTDLGQVIPTMQLSRPD